MTQARKASRAAHEVLTEVMLSVFRVNGRLLQKGDQLVSPIGLTSARWQMLGAIALSDRPVTAPEAAEAMGVTRQGAQKQLDMLVGDGLVEVQPNPRHLRSPHYSLTPRGTSAYESAAALNQLWTRRLASRMAKQDIAIALSVLSALYSGLEGPLPGLEDLE